MGALHGLRVVEVGTGIAVSAAAMLLSDHGAEVVKVEPPGGDPMRSYPGSIVWNRGKRSVVLDLHAPDDRDRFRSLVASADVLIDGFRPGRLEQWGLGSSGLRAALPSLVHCSITGYPPEIDAVDRPGIDLLVQARTGMQYEQPGWREGPIFLYAPLPSYGAAFMALNGILAALHVRETTGRGQRVETSLYQGVLALTTQLWIDAERPGPAFFDIPRNPFFGIMQCADGLWVHSMHNAGGRGRDKSALWRILGIEPLEMGPLDPVLMARNEQIVGEAIGRIPRARLLEEFWANGLAIAPVQHSHEMFDNEQLIHNGMVVDVDDPVVGPTKQMGISFRLHGSPPAAVQGPQPLVGADTSSVLSTPLPRPSMSSAPFPSPHALGDIKVLDIGNFLAGPFGPMLLGDLGATVYKLESLDGDQMRNATKPFLGCQRGKIDLAVDLKTEEGREIAHRLIREVDVVHHNMRPGAAERLGVDYETAKRLNPKIIYCHTTMWGVDGPRRDWPGFDQLGQASSGMEIELGGEGNPPVWYRFGMCDQVCALQSVLAVLMALYWRDHTGEGQFVDTSIVNAGMFLNSDAFIGPDGPHDRPRLDAGQMGISPWYRLYRTADGWIAVACVRPRDRDALTMAVPALAGAADVGAVLEATFAGQTAAEWFARLDAAGVPVEIADPVAGSAWLRAADTAAAGLVAEYEHPDYGVMRQFGELVRLSETPGRIAGPPPLLGEHTVDVLTELGYPALDIVALRERGVISWPEAR